MPRNMLCILIMCILLPIGANASMTVVGKHVPQAEAVGTGRLSFLFWDIYDATLYAPEAQWRQNAPYALAIAYLRELNGEKIAKRSADEIRDLGFGDEARLQEWYKEMKTIFPNVNSDTVLTGVRDSSGQTLFYHNDKRIGVITDTDFADWFFGIWLNEETPEPRLRKRLLGMSEK